ncbi:hypothetical protein SAMN05421854_105324 [Amycolatopsis rubida]|uniref:Uncharacterized protein n=1 Tax=Amycolatopsis rubida TaxID=112413 RepID=A0A1I5QHK0_9PSEU|nr:hypothetical protein SAMN05421854_105324 [Amycolatopsis rubida]
MQALQARRRAGASGVRELECRAKRQYRQYRGRRRLVGTLALEFRRVRTGQVSGLA